jgi:GDP-L-fucose synthase
VTADVKPSIANPKVFVTGANGFLGRHVIDAFDLPQTQLLKPTSAELDLTQANDVLSFFERHRPTHVVHLAAACGGIAANIEQPAHFLHANTMMGLNLLEASRLAGCEKFVLISTTCAYPEQAPMPLAEASIWDGLPTSATRAYGLAKRLLHEAVIQYKAQYGLDGAVLIPANLYGEGDHYDDRSHVVAALIKRYVDAHESGSPSVTNWGTGSATREFLHVADAARAIVMATFKLDHCEPVNLGTGVETSIKELAEMIADIVGYKGKLQWDTTKPSGQPRRSLNVERAKRFGFRAQVDLNDGLRRTMNDYRRRFATLS